MAAAAAAEVPFHPRSSNTTLNTAKPQADDSDKLLAFPYYFKRPDMAVEHIAFEANVYADDKKDDGKKKRKAAPGDEERETGDRVVGRAFDNRNSKNPWNWTVLLPFMKLCKLHLWPYGFWKNTYPKEIKAKTNLSDCEYAMIALCFGCDGFPAHENGEAVSAAASIAYLRDVNRRWHAYVLSNPELMTIVVARKREAWFKRHVKPKLDEILVKIKENEEVTDEERAMAENPMGSVPKDDAVFIDEFKKRGCLDITACFNDPDTRLPKPNERFLKITGGVFKRISEARRNVLLKHKREFDSKEVEQMFNHIEPTAPYGREHRGIGLTDLSTRRTIAFHMRRDVLTTGSIGAVRVRVVPKINMKGNCDLRLEPEWVYLLRQATRHSGDGEVDMPMVQFDTAVAAVIPEESVRDPKATPAASAIDRFLNGSIAAPLGGEGGDDEEEGRTAIETADDVDARMMAAAVAAAAPHAFPKGPPGLGSDGAKRARAEK